MISLLLLGHPTVLKIKLSSVVFLPRKSATLLHRNIHIFISICILEWLKIFLNGQNQVLVRMSSSWNLIHITRGNAKWYGWVKNVSYTLNILQIVHKIITYKHLLKLSHWLNNLPQI